MKLRLAAVSLSLVAAAAALPAFASAQTVAVDRTCYYPGQQGAISGTGFTPGATVNFTRNNIAFGSTQADAAGNLLPSTFTAGNVPGNQQQQTLVASDGVLSASTVFTATNTDVNVTPTRGNPAKKKRIVARGFDQGRTLFGHVRGKRKRNFKVGKVTGPCGKLKKKRRVFGRGFPTGLYTLQFDQSKRYNKNSAPRVVFNVTIFKVLRPASVAGASVFATGQRWSVAR